MGRDIPTNLPPPFFKVRSERIEVLQGTAYVALDRARIDEVHFRGGVLTVRYKIGGEIALDCATAEASDLKRLLYALQAQRDRNQEKARLMRRRNDGGSLLPGITG